MDNRLGSTNDSSKSYTIDPHLSFGPVGCEAPTSPGKKCGETKTLQIMQEFNNMYETKMKQINAEAGGDCVQAKINFQQKWIRDLTEQNDMLVRVVEELELEAADRITMLEEKLQRTSKCACEVMESYNDFSLSLLEDFQKMDRMQSDVQNLLELIRRAKRKGKWDFADLKFYSFDLGEVMNDFSTDEDTPIKLTDQRDKLLKQKNKKIKELEEKLSNLANGGEAEEAFQFKNLSQQYSELKKSMMDMREALTVEVANKHDVILSLRRDVHVLEEQCRKADQQTHFKDDIIKELRKEIKQLKQETSPKNKTRSPCTLKNQRPDPLLSSSLALRDAGDSSVIRHKPKEPLRNQTIIYICEKSSILKRGEAHTSREEDKAGGEHGDSRVVEKDVRSFDAYEAPQQGDVDIFRNDGASKNSIFVDTLGALHADLQSTRNADVSKLGLTDGFVCSQPVWVDSSRDISDLLNRKLLLDDASYYESKIAVDCERRRQRRRARSKFCVCHDLEDECGCCCYHGQEAKRCCDEPTNEVEAKYNEIFSCASNKNFWSKDNTTNISFHDSEIKGSSSPYRVGYRRSSNTIEALSADEKSKHIHSAFDLPPKECPGSSLHDHQNACDLGGPQKPVKLPTRKHRKELSEPQKRNVKSLNHTC